MQLVTRIRIKMCGMTCTTDIAHAISLGVDAIGLIFYEKSPRFITIEQAELILQNIPAFVDVVAVFVNSSAEYVTKVVTELPIQLLQFHGNESPEFCAQFNRPYIKTIPATSAKDITQQAESHNKAAAVLLDTPSAQQGGSGIAFDWQVIPRHLSKPLVLAGGLNAENVVSAISSCSPYAVDVCSGIELSAGIKDHSKMNLFVNALWRKDE